MFFNISVTSLFRNLEEDTRRAIAELAEASQRRIAEREAEKRRVLENLQKENRLREARHSQTTSLAEAAHRQKLVAIKLDGEKTLQELEKEMINEEEEFRREKEVVLEISQELKGQLVEKAEAEQHRHHERMKLYTAFKDSM